MFKELKQTEQNANSLRRDYNGDILCHYCLKRYSSYYSLSYWIKSDYRTYSINYTFCNEACFNIWYMKWFT